MFEDAEVHLFIGGTLLLNVDLYTEEERKKKPAVALPLQCQNKRWTQTVTSLKFVIKAQIST